MRIRNTVLTLKTILGESCQIRRHCNPGGDQDELERFSALARHLLVQEMPGCLHEYGQPLDHRKVAYKGWFTLY